MAVNITNQHLVETDSDSVFLMSLILFFGAFLISITLKQFRNTGYLPTTIRNFLSDFAVIIGIIFMTLLDYFYGLDTPKLVVPSAFKPTWEGRDWVVSHALLFPEHVLLNPWWVDVFLAPVFGLLATILIFMDQGSLQSFRRYLKFQKSLVASNFIYLCEHFKL